MKKHRHPGCLIEIFLGVFIVIIGFLIKIKYIEVSSLWMEILLILLVGYLIKIKKRINPTNRFYKKITKAAKCKDNDEAIYILEDAIEIEYISNEDKILAMEKLAELYLQIGDINKSNYYTNIVLKDIEKDLMDESLSEAERTEKLGKLAIINYDNKKYKQASYYIDKVIMLELNNKKFKITAEGILYIIKIYIANDQKEKAINYYKILLEEKKCKRNKYVEELLDNEINN